jgi:alanine racemase
MGYDFFGVSTLEEALEIKAINEKIEVLIVAKIPEVQVKDAIKNNIILTLSDFRELETFKKARCHIKIDIGMNRLGFKKEEIGTLLLNINNGVIKPEGIYSHFPNATNNYETHNQIKFFKSVLNEMDYEFKWIHMQNSLGCLLYDIKFTNMVRPGIAVLGYYSSYPEKELLNMPLKESLSFYAFVEQIKMCDGYVGYDSQEYYKGKVATLRVGYHDGISRALKDYKFNSGNKILGNICMCQMMIESNNFDGNYFEIFGKNNSLYSLANYQRKITYEIFVAIPPRIERKYTKID